MAKRRGEREGKGGRNIKEKNKIIENKFAS